MKISIDVDLTPQEMRELFGLPDFSGMQQEVINQLQGRIEDGLSGKGVQQLMQAAITGGAQSIEAYQKLLASLVSAGSSKPKSEG
ncbi:MAG: DUF6489 family protein [Pseudomonadaceae bacterium]|nr:DUF6489 family protein [Pseudomonadaceae bacterium]